MSKHRFRFPPLAIGLFAVLLTPALSVATPINVKFECFEPTRTVDVSTLGASYQELSSRHFSLTRETTDFTPATFQRVYFHDLKWFGDWHAKQASFSNHFAFHPRHRWPREKHEDVTPVPEPTGMLFLSAGIVAMSFVRRRPAKE